MIEANICQFTIKCLHPFSKAYVALYKLDIICFSNLSEFPDNENGTISDYNKTGFRYPLNKKKIVHWIQK